MRRSGCRRHMKACRNPSCSSFGVEAMAQVAQGRPRKGEAIAERDVYILNGDPKIAPDSFLKCRACNRTLSIKSNRAIAEELDRISAYLEPPALEDACRTPGCENETMPLSDFPDHYVSKGARGKSRRYRCKACRKTFSVSEIAHKRQRAPHENKTIFKELVSKKPIRGIVEMSELGPSSVYGKIDFIHTQCLGFMGEREARLQKIDRPFARLCVDRQDYMVNWRRKRVRKNIQMTAICTVDFDSGYVLGHHLNYDPDRNQVDIEDAAKISGDYEPGKRSYFRSLPQYWLDREFYGSADPAAPEIRPNLGAEPLLVEQLIKEKERSDRRLTDPEKPDVPAIGNQLPSNGVMTHLDYTAYAHARLIRRFMAHTKYLTIYMDQDEVSRASFISAFAWKVMNGEAEMAYVQFQKQMNIDEKRDLANACRTELKFLVAQFGEGIEKSIALKMAQDYQALKVSKPDWRRRWVPHPKDTLNEPRRRILYLTDTGDKDEERIGWTLSGATLAPVDNYFMRLRRKVNYLERPVPTRANANRLWTGYQAYDPRRVMHLLEIFRTYTNFIWTDSKGRTPAMKFGLSKGPIRFEDILYWKPDRKI